MTAASHVRRGSSGKLQRSARGLGAFGAIVGPPNGPLAVRVRSRRQLGQVDPAWPSKCSVLVTRAVGAVPASRPGRGRRRRARAAGPCGCRRRGEGARPRAARPGGGEAEQVEIAEVLDDRERHLDRGPWSATSWGRGSPGRLRTSGHSPMLDDLRVSPRSVNTVAAGRARDRMAGWGVIGGAPGPADGTPSSRYTADWRRIAGRASSVGDRDHRAVLPRCGRTRTGCGHRRHSVGC